jgi:hypothetical protein
MKLIRRKMTLASRQMRLPNRLTKSANKSVKSSIIIKLSNKLTKQSSRLMRLSNKLTILSSRTRKSRKSRNRQIKPRNKLPNKFQALYRQLISKISNQLKKSRRISLQLSSTRLQAKEPNPPPPQSTEIKLIRPNPLLVPRAAAPRNGLQTE